MLSWFLNSKVSTAVLKDSKQLIQKKMWKLCWKIFQISVVLDDNIDIYLVRQYFSCDAWLLVTEVVQRKGAILAINGIVVYTTFKRLNLSSVTIASHHSGFT